MKLSLQTHAGKAELPVILLIHGLGMNNYFWVDPEKCHVLGGLAPLTIFLADHPEKNNKAISFGTMASQIKGLWHPLQKAGYSIASWTQSQPLGPIGIAVAELHTAVAEVRNQWPGKPVYLIGHSRGGLIARRYLLDEQPADVAGLITICSPHAGTAMAKFCRYLKPAGSFLAKIIPNQSQATLTKALNRLSLFFQSPAIAELAPASEFMASLQKPLNRKMGRLSFGGTSPALFQVAIRLPGNRQKIVRFPDLLAGVIPPGRLPPELTPGLGDALVSAASAELGGGDHYNFPANHVKAAYDHAIHKKILAFLDSAANAG